MNSAIALCLILAFLVLNAWATRAVMLDAFSSSKQRLAQVLFVWCVPVVGAFLVLYMNREEADKLTGKYREEPDSSDDSELLHRNYSRIHRHRIRETLESDSANHGADTSSD